MAGGCCYESSAASGSGSRSRGPTRAAPRAPTGGRCRDLVFELEPEMGWDGVDEVMAELRGYTTAGFVEFGFRHHRKVG